MFVLLHVCETWPFTLQERGLEKLNVEVLLNLQSSSNIIRTKRRTVMRWMGHLELRGGKKCILISVIWKEETSWEI
jgi:hypothetical protein